MLRTAKKIGKDVAAYYNERSGGLVVLQTISDLNKLYETVPEIEGKFVDCIQGLQVFLGTFLSENVEFKLGPVKKRSVAEEKIERDYDGKVTLISDIVRGKLVVKSREAVEELVGILDPDNGKEDCFLGQYGIQCVQLNNHFIEPKFETGYRCINAKLSIPIEGTDECHIVELQIVHDAIEKTYHLTHEHMREAQKIAAEYNNCEMPNEAAMRRHAHYAVCRYHNGKNAKEAGLDDMLLNKNDALSDEEAVSLHNMIRYFRFDFY